jgi:hypothetical protein
MRPRRWQGLLAIGVALALAAGIARTALAAPPQRVTPIIGPAALQQVILIWASGTPAVQDEAHAICRQQRWSDVRCAAISAAVRRGWLDIAARDPASVGRVGVAANPNGRALALHHLAHDLDKATGGELDALLRETASAFAVVSKPHWATKAATVIGRPIVGETVLVWATSYLQTSLPAGMDPYHSQYAALPDDYLSLANAGNISAIPAIYQPYYAPGGVTAHWSVSVSTPNGEQVAAQIPITDVGPWNEDDNWWDPNGTSTTLPASCPVASTLPAPDATSNPLVNGICPNGQNLRRLYYYLLYQHGGLPFFQSANYSPSGPFRDGGPWPSPLDRYCSETIVASITDDGLTCDGGAASYNGNNGAWLRESVYDGPILNQSSIDLSPAVDAALGWVYPSSGLVRVFVGGLP